MTFSQKWRQQIRYYGSIMLSIDGYGWFSIVLEKVRSNDSFRTNYSPKQSRVGMNGITKIVGGDTFLM